MSRSEEAASHSRTIPVVIAASDIQVKVNSKKTQKNTTTKDYEPTRNSTENTAPPRFWQTRQIISAQLNWTETKTELKYLCDKKGENKFLMKDTEQQNDVRLGDKLGLTATVDITLK